MEKTDIKDRLGAFLKIATKMKEPAVIFAPASEKGTLVGEIMKAFEKRKVQKLEPGEADKDQIDKIFKGSLKDGSVLLVYLDKKSSEHVIRRLEQILEDGHIPVSVGGTWSRVEPVENWQCLVLVNRDQIKEDEFSLRELFPHKLVI
jgi:hypothetical protein